MAEMAIQPQVHSFVMGTGMSPNRNLQSRAHLFQRADMVGMGVGHQYADGDRIGQHPGQCVRLSAGIN
jgi:hypothetical protein